MKQKQKKEPTPAVTAARYGLFISLAFLFSYIETLFPIYLGAPGIKLGLANLVTIVGLYTVGNMGTALINGVRILLANITFGNLFGMLYGGAGAALSMLLMIVCKKRGWFSIVGISVIGGIGHNIGQLFIAAFVVQTAGVFSYLPVLLAAGTIAGAFIGLLGGMVVERIQGYVKRL